MSLFAGRYMLMLVLLAGLMGFGLGYVHWNSDDVRCFQRKSWTFEGWHTWLSLGKLEFRYHPLNFDCDNEWKFDPSKYQKQGDGTITPRFDTSTQ